MADALANISNDRIDLAELEEIERQNALRGNERSIRRPGRNWGISPSIERASASREKKPPPQLPMASKPVVAVTQAPTTAPIRMTADCELYRLILDFEALQDGFADRIDDLNVPLTEVDSAGEMTRGNAQKLLSKSDAKWARKFGWESLGKMLRATGMMLILVIDDERFAPIREQMAKREKPRRPLQQHCRLRSPDDGEYPAWIEADPNL